MDDKKQELNEVEFALLNIRRCLNANDIIHEVRTTEIRLMKLQKNLISSLKD